MILMTTQRLQTMTARADRRYSALLARYGYLHTSEVFEPHFLTERREFVFRAMLRAEMRKIKIAGQLHRVQELERACWASSKVTV